MPTTTDVAGSVGEREVHTLDDLKAQRPQTIAFDLTRRLLDRYFRDADEDSVSTDRLFVLGGDGTSVTPKRAERPWLFPTLLRLVRQWMDDPNLLILKDNAFPQLLGLAGNASDAADKIYLGIRSTAGGSKQVRPMLRAWEPVGSTRYVDFDTARPCWRTDPAKCHVSHVAADTDSWEQRMAQALEEMPEVVRYVKNQSLGFTIPYTLDGKQHAYNPDFIACIDDGRGPEDLLNLVIEVTGKTDKAKQAKTSTARELWVPAVNNHGGFGRWAFVEVTDPWDAHATIRATVRPSAAQQATAEATV